MTESKLEEILKERKSNGAKLPAEKTQPLKSALEQALEQADAELGKQLLRTQAEELIEHHRLNITRMRGAQNAPDTGGKRSQELTREGLVDVIQDLLAKGLDPERIGRITDFLLGNHQATYVGLPGSPAPAQGMTFTDMIAFYKTVQESNKTDPALTAILNKLVEKVDAIEKRPLAQATPPQRSFLLVKADGSVQEVDAGKPIILEPRPVLVEGEPLDVLKEKNHHEEEMLTRQGQITHNKNLSDTLAEIPESLLAIAEAATGKGQEQPGVVSATMQYLKCATEGCGFDIPFPPAAVSITCPKCGSIYTKKAEA